MTNNIPKLIKETIDMVKDIPEEYRKNSFEVLLNYFLIRSISSSDINRKKQSVQKHSETDDDIQDILNSNYDWASTGIKKMSGITQYIRILDIVQKEFNTSTLSAFDIKRILEQKFRQKKTTNAINMSLMRSVGNYVDRIKKDNGYQYGITASGGRVLEQTLGKMKNEN